MSLRFFNASYLNENFDLITDAEIIVCEDIIKYAGKRKIKGTFEREIDLTGKLVLPGFINTHNHSPLSLLKGAAENLSLFDWLHNAIFPAEKKFTEEHIYWGCLLSVAESLKHGITCTGDMYFYPEILANVYASNNITAVILGTANDGYSSADEQAQLYKKINYKTVSFIPGIHAPYSCSEKLLSDFSDMVSNLKCLINCHLAETLDEVGECTVKHQDKTPAMYLYSLGLFDYGGIAAHCVHVDKEDIKLLKNCNVSVSHNPSSNLKLISGIAPVYTMLLNGVNVCLGSDSAASNNSIDIMKEMYLAALLQKQFFYNPDAVTTKQALSMSTINGAKALCLKNTGLIKEGYKADLCILNLKCPEALPSFNILNKLVYSMNSSNVDYTVCNGKILYEKGNYRLNEDIDTILNKANMLAQKLI